jgi:hypothetical protein
MESVVVGALTVAFAFGELAGASPSGQSMVAEGKREFCSPRVARNFLGPFARMLPIHHVPRSGKLPFAPKGLLLEAKGGRLVVGGGQAGFGLRDEAVGQVRHLNWDVSTRLLKVDSRGEVVADLGSKRRRIGSIGGSRIKDFLFRVPGEPAYYRVDISFVRSGSDRVLGEFSRYVRVVRPKFDVRLLMLKSAARQGEVLSIRLANFGTETVSSISHDWGFTVHQFNGQDWVIAPSNPPPEKHRPIIRKLPPGQMADCIHFRVPADEVPGFYRFSMDVNRSMGTTEDRRVQLTAEFEISAR